MQFTATLIILPAITILMWGLWGFFGKLALDRGMSPMAMFVVELTVGFACAAVVATRAFAAAGPNAGRPAWNCYGFLSGVGLTLGLVAYYYALSRQQASIVVPLTSIYPAVTALLAYAVLGERLGRAQWVGLVLAIAGACLLSMTPTK